MTTVREMPSHESRARGRRRPPLAAVPALLTVLFAGMSVAWLMATPPGSSFDEPAHYIKAIGVGHGDYRGRPLPPAKVKPADLRAFFALTQGDARSLKSLLRSSANRWQVRTSRRFRVPAGLLRPEFGCTLWNRRLTGSCLEHRTAGASAHGGYAVTYTGTYQPFLYVPAGVAMRAAHTPEAAMRLGRAATLAVGAALLTASIWLLWSPTVGALSLLGLVATVTPMVVFVSSVLSTSGPEITGALCFSAALLRLARDDGMPSRWFWAALAGGGAVLSCARTLGPAFLILALVSVAILAGPRRFLRRLREGGRPALGAAAVILVAATAGVWWQATFQPHPEPDRTSLRQALQPSLDRLYGVGKEAVGVFGALDAQMPGWAYIAWSVLILVLITTCLAVGSIRDRISVVGVVAAVVLVTLVMSLVYREIGPLHGRYAMPYLLVLPLWLGEVLVAHRDRLARAATAALLAGVLTTATVVQVVGWWASARRFAVTADGPWLFLGDADWAPPGGWWPFVIAVAGAAAAGLAAAVIAVRERPRSSPADPVAQPPWEAAA